ncbi:hypothetical protein CANCADRAFT_56982 [Tortispora caseinolytica NRRL Y-17796]|uniref:Uncharacterized protein n=1 Tax=Tortispora caseinolytica NRRL Y-17796 TaxID=767744 RepID=A0A1E4TFD7_9ASCO|nr:hypothetical protein CANCADRAFT_56982 [Tortispora caseinolytica NRRL Y-17796]
MVVKVTFTGRSFAIEDVNNTVLLDTAFEWNNAYPGHKMLRRYDWQDFVVLAQHPFRFNFTMRWVPCMLSGSEKQTIRSLRNRASKILNMSDPIPEEVLHGEGREMFRNASDNLISSITNSELWSTLDMTAELSAESLHTFESRASFSCRMNSYYSSFQQDNVADLDSINITLTYYSNLKNDIDPSVITLADIALRSLIQDKLSRHMPLLFVPGFHKAMISKASYLETVATLLLSKDQPAVFSQAMTQSQGTTKDSIESLLRTLAIRYSQTSYLPPVLLK